MGNFKFMFTNFLLVLFLLTSSRTVANNYPPCPLPPPATLQIVNSSYNSLTLNWAAVPGAAIYRISVYDVTAQYTLPVNYSTGTSITVTGLNTVMNSYVIGVSASSCLNNPQFGPEIQVTYEPGIIIIQDEIVQMSCPPPSNSSVWLGTVQQQLALPFNEDTNPLVNTRQMRISRDGDQTTFVNFLIWVDCYHQVRFKQLSTQKATITNAGSKLSYGFVNGNGYAPFFDIITTVCDNGICNVIIRYRVDCNTTQESCAVTRTPSTCGEKPPGFNARIDSGAGSNVPVETLKSDRMGATKNGSPATDGIKVAPNPFSDHLRIQYDLEQSGPAGVRLFSSTGTMVKQVIPFEWHEQGAHGIDVPMPDDLPAGMYFIVLQTDDKRIAMPVIKE